MKIIIFLMYIFCIVISNVLTASFNPLNIYIFLIPYGTFLIGITFVIRDFIQLNFGKKITYKIICLALIISAITSFLLDDSLYIVFASAITFLISEVSDTEIFSRIKSRLSNKILYSGMIGGFLDSVIFVLIGLSPIGANFIPWEFIFTAIIGQIIVKFFMQFIAYFIVKKLEK